jgi:hypothetical protein
MKYMKEPKTNLPSPIRLFHIFLSSCFPVKKFRNSVNSVKNSPAA